MEHIQSISAEATTEDACISDTMRSSLPATGDTPTTSGNATAEQALRPIRALIAQARRFSSDVGPAQHGPPIDAALIERAYRHCGEITKSNSETVYLGSWLMPPQQRKAIWALYAFARLSDDLSDTHAPERHEHYRRHCRQMHQWPPPQRNLVAVAWSETRRIYRIPLAWSQLHLDGLGKDLNGVHISTYEDFVRYAFGSSCPVPVMGMYITGHRDPLALSYAVTLGIALLLSNHLRDIGEDYRNGRVYMPAQELSRFGISGEQLAAGRVDNNWRRFMEFQIERARTIYQHALPGLKHLSPAGRLAAAAISELYLDLLTEIQLNDCDVFRRHAHVPTTRKLLRLPKIAYRAFVTGYE